MLLIGIDPSPSNTGVVLLNFDEEKQLIEILDFHNIETRGGNIYKNLSKLQKTVYKYCFEWVCDYGAEYIIFEYSNIFLQGKSSSFINSKMQGAYYVVGVACHDIETNTKRIKEPINIISNTVKAVLFPKLDKKEKRKRITKLDVKKLINELISNNKIILSESIKNKRRDDNINDAIAVVLAGIKKYNIATYYFDKTNNSND